MSETRALADLPSAPDILRRSKGGRDRGRVGGRLTTVVATAVFAAIVLAVILAPILSPYDPNQQDLTAILQAPSSKHLLGTDVLGRDILSRVLWGGGPPLLVGTLSVLIALVVGVSLGLVAGYSGRMVDGVLSRLADIQMSIPGLVLALLVLALLGSSINNVILVIAIESWPLHFRISRSQVQMVRGEAYLEAARLAGLGRIELIGRHILPSTLPLLSVTGTFNFATAVLTEAALSFLGLGVQPPRADWGLMISDGQAQLSAAWWISVFPGISLLLLLLSVQVIGDWLAARFSSASSGT